MYKRLLYKPLETYFNSILSQYPCGFRKGFSVLTTPLPLTEKWRDYFDLGGNFSALLTDLSKAFDCLSHNQPAITCSKLTTETLEQGLKYV